MEIFVVLCTSLKTKQTAVSQEGYKKLDDAIKFVENRSDNPEPIDISLMNWVGKFNEYTIKIISVK